MQDLPKETKRTQAPAKKPSLWNRAPVLGRSPLGHQGIDHRRKPLSDRICLVRRPLAAPLPPLVLRFCNGPRSVNPFCVVHSPGSRFATGRRKAGTDVIGRV